MNKKIETAPLTTIFHNDNNKSIDKLIKKIEMNQKECKYMSGELCKLLKEVKEDFITLQTPFDIVYIKLKKNKKSEVNETEVHSGPWSSYVNLSKAIEELIPDKQERLKSLEKIYEYLSILKDENIKNIKQFNNKVENAFNVKNTNEYNEYGENIRKKGKQEEESKRRKNIPLAYLSAILMISEPFRFNDGGGLSRGAIRYMYVNLMNGKNDAISYTLGSKKEKSHLLFARESGKKYLINKIEEYKNKNIENVENKNTENNMEIDSAEDENTENNMELGYLSEDDDNKYSLRRKGISEKEEKEIIKKAYQKGEIHFFQAVGKIRKLKNKSPKKSKQINKKIFRSKPKDKNTNVNIKPIKKKKI